ncbi:MAG: type II and III secretion system protein [Candidatus Marinimicrobia bacterium]|nr:type II and III secretion system protein [Candidatus Neomarinimicrobiota bacterium]MCF7850419.1 type II and III secretion system protein [Candidatus Neomarinimicrobiota bacterium]MCF7905014.1 type II and III secretion system protein [Candidatus Neomarinimicrobiota bacterium]
MQHYSRAFSLRIKEGFSIFCLLALIGFLTLPTQLLGQRLPTAAVSPDEMVSFQPNTTFQQAIQIISLLSSQHEGKVVIDPTGTKGPINIAIPPSHWLKALELVARAKGLEYAEKSTYYEIRKPTARSTGPSVAKPAAPIVQSGSFPLDTREIEISAIFFQGDRRSLAEVGVDWSAITDIGTGDTITVGNNSAFNVSQELLSIGGSYNAAFGQATTSVMALLQTFEALNYGEIISNPSIQVMDKTTGRIQVGEKFSIKQKDFSGNTIENFFDVGTILEVTPEVIQEQDVTFIHLAISAERSSAFPDPVSTRIANQTAVTNVLLLDGEQTVIAGLYSEEVSEVRKGIPILKDLPWWVLGIKYLAGFDSDDVIEKELVIIIKAQLVPTISDRLEKRHARMRDLIEEERQQFKDNIEANEDQ